jgi:hypothetical protein
MKERPILFSAPMVRAILDGRKTQTRRVMKPQPLEGIERQFPFPRIKDGNLYFHAYETDEFPMWMHHIKCPHEVGMRLWVRETHWQYMNRLEVAGYCADGEQTFEHHVIKVPSIHVPRWASRITLEITGVRVERLQDITEEDAKAEGAGGERYSGQGFEHCIHREAFRTLWESINGPGTWELNPWLWVIEFRRIA